jgi:hypothetical protein
MAGRAFGIVGFLVCMGFAALTQTHEATACHDIYAGCSAICKSVASGDCDSIVGSGGDDLYKTTATIVYAGTQSAAGVVDKTGRHVGDPGGPTTVAAGDSDDGLAPGSDGKVYFRVEWDTPRDNRTDTTITYRVWSDDGVTNVTTAAQDVFMPANNDTARVVFFDFHVNGGSKKAVLHLELRSGELAPARDDLVIPVKQTWVVPWLLILTIVLIVVILVIVWLSYSRRHHEPDPPRGTVNLA